MVRPTEQPAEEGITVQTDTSDIRISWLTCLENMVLSMSRLRHQCPTLYNYQMEEHLKFAIESTVTAEKAIAELRWKLMDIWGIRESEVMRWMDLGADEYRKRMDRLTYTVSRSGNSAERANGPRKNSRKR